MLGVNCGKKIRRLEVGGWRLEVIGFFFHVDINKLEII